MLPLVPVAVRLIVPVAAVSLAVKSEGTLAPAFTVKGERGFATIPVGSMPSETCTWPENPFS